MRLARQHIIFALTVATLFSARASAVQDEQYKQIDVKRDSESFSLSNKSITATWRINHGLRWQSLSNRFTQANLNTFGEVFELVPREGPIVRSSEMDVIDQPAIGPIPAMPDAPKAADRSPGKQIRVELADRAGNVRVTWKAILRADTNYIREEVTVKAMQQSIPLARVILLDVNAFGASISGNVKGSPITAGDGASPTWFFGFEHPLSECRVSFDHASCWLERELPIPLGRSVTYSVVYGVAHTGQLRRDFLKYIELERAHPYRTFLHYNSWYDLGYFDRYTEQGAVAVVQNFGEQLTKQRSVKLDSFLFDDGWDDPATLWKFNPGFPNGLTKVSGIAAKYGASPGIWLSPWGGYDKPKEQRLVSAHAQGFETNEGGLALSGPKYYRYFRDTCLEMIEKYSVSQFKFDGTGNANEVIAGSEFDSDFDAAIHLIDELRAKKPDLYVNLTTGTYPSPFWLLYADSIWRGGDDHSFAGVGSNRQRWITYRDSQTYRWVVQDGPLFPLNSLMLHGMIFARYAERLNSDPNHDFADEVHSYFGTGTQLQEMYITPSLLSPQDWDVLAEAAKWSRDNAQVLKDTHWFGGDPALLQIYGWAAWSPEKAILTLRNPSDHEQNLTASLAALLELPAGAATKFSARSPWKDGSAKAAQTFDAQEQQVFRLEPFEVLTLELTPNDK
jgi:hypothetical protein